MAQGKFIMTFMITTHMRTCVGLVHANVFVEQGGTVQR